MVIEILCPACLLPMRLVEAKKHYQDSGPIIVDQCHNCGGIWFDDSELFAIRHGEAEKIEEFNSSKFKKVSEISSRPLSCPRDKNELSILQDQFFPQDIKVEICKKCYGFWFNRGEFVDFQKKRKEMITHPRKIKDPELDRMIRDCLDLSSNKKKNELIRAIGKVLSSNPYYRVESIESISDTEKNVSFVANSLVSILGAVAGGYYKKLL